MKITHTIGLVLIGMLIFNTALRAQHTARFQESLAKYRMKYVPVEATSQKPKYSVSQDLDRVLDTLMQRPRVIHCFVVQGYSVGIHRGKDKAEAFNIRKQLHQRFPKLPISFVYHNTWYRLRIGYFKREADCKKLLAQLKPDFPKAYIWPLF